MGNRSFAKGPQWLAVGYVIFAASLFAGSHWNPWLLILLYIVTLPVSLVFFALQEAWPKLFYDGSTLMWCFYFGVGTLWYLFLGHVIRIALSAIFKRKDSRSARDESPDVDAGVPPLTWLAFAVCCSAVAYAPLLLGTRSSLILFKLGLLMATPVATLLALIYALVRMFFEKRRYGGVSKPILVTIIVGLCGVLFDAGAWAIVLTRHGE